MPTEPDELVDGVPVEWLIDLVESHEEEARFFEEGTGSLMARADVQAAMNWEKAENIRRFLRRKGVRTG
jgi:hypothetical protein